MQTRPIEIDLEVHKMIESAKKSFSETENDVLRRLLRIAPTPASFQEEVADPHASEGRPWSWKGLTLPHGTLLRMSYGGSSYEGRVVDGNWEVSGELLKSPSAAAVAAVEKRTGRRISLNGWIYWQVRRPNDRQWRPIKALAPK